MIIWDAVTAAPVHQFSLPGADTIWDIAWSGDAKQLAIAHGQAIVLVEPSGRQLHWLAGHTRRVYSVAWSPDSRFLASGSGDHTIFIWDTASWAVPWVVQRVLTAHARSVYAVVWSPSGGQLASASKDKVIGLWDTSTWTLRARLQGHTGWVVSLGVVTGRHEAGQCLA